MNTRDLLDQLLKSGQEMLQNSGANPQQPEKEGQKDVLGGLLGGSGLGGLLSGAGGGALAASALSVLLGSGKMDKVGGKALTYGGLATLGVMAYKAYSNWQAQQASAPQHEPQTLDRLPAAQVEEHSHAILKALVAAAKADGHIDEREQQLIDAELSKLSGDPAMRQWLQIELKRPLDPTDVASVATTPEMAAEMYLASVMMVDGEQFMERAYLDELAHQLNLKPELKAELEAQVRPSGG